MGAICRLKRVRAWSRGRAFLRGVAGSATMLAQGAAGEPQAGTPGPGAGGGEVPRLPGPDGRRVQHQPPVCAVMRLRTARPSVPPGLCPAASVPGCTSCGRVRVRADARTGGGRGRHLTLIYRQECAGDAYYAVAWWRCRWFAARRFVRAGSRGRDGCQQRGGGVGQDSARTDVGRPISGRLRAGGRRHDRWRRH